VKKVEKKEPLTLKLEDLKNLIKQTITETLTNQDWFKHLENCPQCQTKTLEILNKTGKIKDIKKEWLERKNLEYLCTECGFPVKIDEKECPICGNTKAQKRT
jgi:rubrerythrin